MWVDGWTGRNLDASMASKKKPRPSLVYADKDGSIFDEPGLSMLCRRGRELVLPRPEEFIPLPEECDIFLLPERSPLGFDPDSGSTVCLDDAYAVAAFACPGYTLTGTTAYQKQEAASPLPLFAYGALGYAQGRFWICAKQVDADPRQRFLDIPQERIDQGIKRWLSAYPDNRLVRHLSHCALSSCCPAARNLALGRYEAPLPTSQGCNADCLGCISQQPEQSGFPATQDRIAFRPTAEEICQIMLGHAKQEAKPIFSFGQGCEGEPLLETELIARSMASFRRQGGPGTININTNGSLPESMAPLAAAGLDSVRISLNSARPEIYEAYYRPRGYTFSHVREAIHEAKRAGLFVSLNLLFFPGLNDSEEEYQALTELIREDGVDFMQLRNLNLDPDLYLECLPEVLSPSMGLPHFKKRLSQDCPGLGIGYFNPYLGPG